MCCAAERALRARGTRQAALAIAAKSTGSVGKFDAKAKGEKKGKVKRKLDADAAGGCVSSPSPPHPLPPAARRRRGRGQRRGRVQREREGAEPGRAIADRVHGRSAPRRG